MKNSDTKILLDSFFTHTVSQYIDPEGLFRKKLTALVAGDSKERVIIKYGVDPTRPDIHLGHVIGLEKLRVLQDFGCFVVFLVGDFTAQIGDPTGKNKTRPEIAHEAVKKNAETFFMQASKILDTAKTKYVCTPNSLWYESISDYTGKNLADKARRFELDRAEIISLTPALCEQLISPRVLLSALRTVTHGRLIERDMFQKRLKDGEPLFMHEMLYPVLQGLDSCVIAKLFGSCDLEIGGTDQTFNMLMGRDLMLSQGLAPQAVLSLELLVGLDGKEKMSKSLDNYIAITDIPSDMYGKVMSLPDAVMPVYYEMVLGMSKTESEEIKKEIQGGTVNPRDIKMRLAKAIVVKFWSDKEADKAEQDFITTFSKKGIPDEVQEVSVAQGSSLATTLVETGVVKSKTDFRRLVEEGAVSIGESGEKITDVQATVEKDAVYKVGKRRFLKVKVL